MKNSFQFFFFLLFPPSSVAVSNANQCLAGKNAAQVEAHEKWYQNLQRLRREQRQELDEWKRRKRLMDEEERKRLAEESQEDPNGDTWVAEWRRQRPNVRQQLERWKVIISIY